MPELESLFVSMSLNLIDLFVLALDTRVSFLRNSDFKSKIKLNILSNKTK